MAAVFAPAMLCADVEQCPIRLDRCLVHFGVIGNGETDDEQEGALEERCRQRKRPEVPDGDVLQRGYGAVRLLEDSVGFEDAFRTLWNDRREPHVAAHRMRIAAGTRAHAEEIHVRHAHVLWIDRPFTGSLTRISLDRASLESNALDRLRRQFLYRLPLRLNYFGRTIELQVECPVGDFVVLPVLLQLS
ncbi:hypothetical protein D9M69_543890 [compost metagenome]